MTSNHDKDRLLFNKDIGVLIKALIIGKVLTLVVIGGILLWLKLRLSIYSNAPSNEISKVVLATADKSSFQEVEGVPIGSFKYGGSRVWTPIRQLVDSQIQNARPELQLHYVTPDNHIPSSSAGIRMLLDGQLDIAQSSRPLTEVERAIAQQRGFTLEQRPVAIDGIAVVVNRSLPVAGLTVEQLQQIYQGKITNWRQVGGPDLPITPFSQRPDDVDAAIFTFPQSESPLPHGSNVQYVSSTTEALRQVSNFPGGLYYASARAAVLQCSVKPLPIGRRSDRLVPPYREPLVPASKCPRQRNQLNTEAFKDGSYPITYKLFVIIKQNHRLEQQAGEAYAQLLLSTPGQKAIEQAGFTPIPASQDIASQ